MTQVQRGATGFRACPRCNKPRGEEHEPNCKEAEMQVAASARPQNFENLSAEEQWAIDKSLGCLDWEGY